MNHQQSSLDTPEGAIPSGRLLEHEARVHGHAASQAPPLPVTVVALLSRLLAVDAAGLVPSPLGKPASMTATRSPEDSEQAADGLRGAGHPDIRWTVVLLVPHAAAPDTHQQGSSVTQNEPRRSGTSNERQPRPSGSISSLTARELEVLTLVADGSTNHQIAAALWISPKTASVHVSRILTKLGTPTRAGAAGIAHRSGILDG